MNRIDAAAFLATAVSVPLVNAVLAVATGYSLYVLRAISVRRGRLATREHRRRDHVGDLAVRPPKNQPFAGHTCTTIATQQGGQSPC